jgi:hypothetical protein
MKIGLLLRTIAIAMTKRWIAGDRDEYECDPDMVVLQEKNMRASAYYILTNHHFV